MKNVYTQLLILFVFYGFIAAQTGSPKHHAQMPLNCQECHSCPDPTYEKPCLKIFPDFTRGGISVHHSVDEAPGMITIDTLSAKYGPSHFSHRLHAEMGQMAGGCVFCHHHNPPGKVLACVECHQASGISDDPSRPSLKGAYHQQCLNCHRSWDAGWRKKSDCLSCHAAKGNLDTPSENTVKKDNAAKKHPKIEEPTRVVYQTEYEDGPMVTFFHNDHTEKFGLTCADCHQNESCNRCHAQEKDADKSLKEAHENCSSCHEEALDENCEKCHGIKEKSRFTHASVGWELNRFHNSLSCSDCHGEGTTFKKLNKRCTACHKKWITGSFDHKRAGLALDENHFELDCENCHLDRKFNQKPVCSECHDDFSFPKQKPGKPVRIR